MKKMFIITLLIINLFIISSCSRRSELEEIGFVNDLQKLIAIAARNKSVTYNINEPIVFDLYIGYDKDRWYPLGKTVDDSYYTVCYALYFGSVGYIEKFQPIPSYTNKDKVYEPIIDYKIIPGFIREIPLEEIASEEYHATLPDWGRRTFNHSEEITIPKEYVENLVNSGDKYSELFRIHLVVIGYHKDVGYVMTKLTSLELVLHYLDEENIKLYYHYI